MQLKQKHSRTWHIYRLGVQRTLKEHNCMLHGRMVTCVRMRYDGAQDGGKNRVCVVGTSGGGGSGGVGEGSIIFLLIFLSLFLLFPLLRLLPFLPCPLPLPFLPAVVPVSLFLGLLTNSFHHPSYLHAPAFAPLVPAFNLYKILVGAWWCAIKFAAMWPPHLLLLLCLLVLSCSPWNTH